VEFFRPAGDRYDLAALEETLARVEPDLVFLEAVSNPMLIVADLARVIALARAAGAAVVLDNTFATPLLCRPLELGADIVLHSATKYLAGHNDITAGVVCGDDPERMREAVEYRKLTGHMLAATEAYALETRLKTFRLRTAAQNGNAARLAALLDAHPAVARVLYPGLASHPTRAEAEALFGGRGGGAVVTFDLAGADPAAKGAAARRFLEAVGDRIPLVPTLGDVDSLLLHVESVWGDKYPEPGMFRLSVGIEECARLEEALRAGLAAAG
jgi:cystathionine beta-lyase/cystathionine gamma-synthase